MINLSAIDPKRHSRYSPNLFKWLSNPDRKNSYLFHEIKVYRDSENILWIGWFDLSVRDNYNFLSVRLISVLCDSKENWGWRNRENMTEIEGFWQQYEAIGRCAIDPDHNMFFVGDEHRWRQEGDTRYCQWCSRVTQRLHTWTETVERQAWRNAGKEARP